MKIEYLDADILKRGFIGAYNSLEIDKEMVNALNVFPVPDGDTGTNMALTMNSAVKEIRSGEELSIDEILNRVAKGSLMGARGNSGVILSQLLRGFTKKLTGVKKIGVKELALAFKEGSDMAYKAVMKPTEGTILTVGRGCAEKAMEVSRSETDIVEFFRRVVEYGNRVLDKTPDMLPVLKEAGVVDAGGKGLLVILEGALKSVIEEGALELELEATVDHSPYYVQDDIEFGYCTEFIVNKATVDPEQLKKEIERYGDSMLVVGGEGMIKVHIHTNNPGEVIEKGLRSGELIDIKIDNMRYQHRESYMEGDSQPLKKENKKYGIVAISVGEGLKKIFEDFRVDEIISGGQTMNPSTEDILKAVDRIDAEHIIILPNNKNIILSATQAKEISEKNIEVLMTKSIQQGIASLIAFDETSELEENMENMTEAFKAIKTGEVTFSVKDTVIDGKEINKDDIMGLASKRIESVGQDVPSVTLELVEKLVDGDSEIVTLFYGEDVPRESAERLAKKLEEKYPDMDIEMVPGGQPLYYYLISIE